MPIYEYRAVPAPRKGLKAKGVKTPEDRFAHAVAEVMNRLAAEGWEYLRAETLPAEERTGWTGKSVETTHHLLIFRRDLAAAEPAWPAEPAWAAEPTVVRPAAGPRLAASREAPEEYPAPRLGPARDQT